jgi:hypothetical protein
MVGLQHRERTVFFNSDIIVSILDKKVGGGGGGKWSKHDLIKLASQLSPNHSM